MKLETIHLKRFRQHADTRIAFPAEGIIGLVGPNEGGKSTVMEAIAWNLYGSRAARGTVDSIRWNGAPARKIAEVTLTFAVGGTRYRVHRTENDAELREVEGRIIAEGIQNVDARVPGLLGMDLDEFESTYFARQGDLKRLEQMGGTAKRQFVLQLMGLGEIDDALEACREEKNRLRNELSGMREGLGDREPLVEERDAAHQALAVAKAELETARAEARNKRRLQALAEEELEAAREAKERHDQLDSRLEAAVGTYEEAEAELEAVKDKLDAAREAEAGLAERRPEIGPLSDLHEERQELVEARSHARERETVRELVEELRGKVEFVEEQIGDLEQAVEELSDAPGQVQDSRDRVETLRARRDELADSDKVAALRRHLEAGEACPVCEQTVDDVPAASDALEELERIEAELSEAREAFEEAKSRGTRLVRAREDLERTRERLQGLEDDLAARQDQLADLPDRTFDADRFAEVEAEIERLEAIEKELRRLKVKADRVEELESDADRWREKRDAASEKASGLRSELEEVDFDPGRFDRLSSEASTQRAQAQAAAEKASKAEAERDAAADRLERAESALEAYEQRAERVREVAEAHQVHVEADERLTAFRAAEAASVRPELEELVSSFLAILTDGRHEAVELTEDFDVTAYETGHQQEVISGGAQDVAAIALRLAISQLIAERAGHPLSLLVLDEPFGSLDPTRQDNVLQLIERLSGVFHQVLLISHVERIQESCDTVFGVSYDEAEGMSRVELVSAGPVEEVAA